MPWASVTVTVDSCAAWTHCTGSATTKCFFSLLILLDALMDQFVQVILLDGAILVHSLSIILSTQTRSILHINIQYSYII